MIPSHSFIELSARERARAILDNGTFREILGPFDRLESPWLEPQGIVPASDDGVIVARGKIVGESAVVLAIEGAFQGGSTGEVSGAKIAGSLELALKDCEQGVLTRPVLLLETGGVRLQEANLGLAVIAEIQTAIVALRRFVPVVGVIAGPVGCFGGMAISAGLCSYLIMTREARLALNGPEVIEQEAGPDEFDAADRPLIWSVTGGEQRYAIGQADYLVNDDTEKIVATIHEVFERGLPAKHRSNQINEYLELLQAVDPASTWEAKSVRELFRAHQPKTDPSNEASAKLENRKTENGRRTTVDGRRETTMSRGSTWFYALAGDPPQEGNSSILVADRTLGAHEVRYLAVVPNPRAKFPRARGGEVGLEEGWTLAKYVREVVDNESTKRSIVAIVDVPSQAYGRREELLGIHLACAAAAGAYAAAWLSGHPVVTLIVGSAFSGGVLAHGYQSGAILALDAPGVTVHAMGKAAAARVTRRTVQELDELGQKIVPMAYDIRTYAKLGIVQKLITEVDADNPREADIERVQQELIAAIVAQPSRDLSRRFGSANNLRVASAKVRERLAAAWNVP